jgi:hypothetical protein
VRPWWCACPRRLQGSRAGRRTRRALGRGGVLSLRCCVAVFRYPARPRVRVPRLLGSIGSRDRAQRGRWCSILSVGRRRSRRWSMDPGSMQRMCWLSSPGRCGRLYLQRSCAAWAATLGRPRPCDPDRVRSRRPHRHGPAAATGRPVMSAVHGIDAAGGTHMLQLGSRQPTATPGCSRNATGSTAVPLTWVSRCRWQPEDAPQRPTDSFHRLGHTARGYPARV